MARTNTQLTKALVKKFVRLLTLLSAPVATASLHYWDGELKELIKDPEVQAWLKRNGSG